MDLDDLIKNSCSTQEMKEFREIILDYTFMYKGENTVYCLTFRSGDIRKRKEFEKKSFKKDPQKAYSEIFGQARRIKLLLEEIGNTGFKIHAYYKRGANDSHYYGDITSQL